MIKLFNAQILTMEPDRPIIEQGEIHIRGDRIAYVGEHPIEELVEFDREINCHGNLLMPGFKDAHTHSGMLFLRSHADGMELKRWLRDVVFVAEAKLTPEDITACTKLAILEYLSSGITGIMDMYIDPDATARACMDLGMRCALVSGLSDTVSSIEMVASRYERLNRLSPLISYKLGFHAQYSCSKDLLRELTNLVHQYRAPVYAHISETYEEVERCRQECGMTPPVYLDSMGIFDYGGGGYHCVHMTDNDIRVFIRRGLSVITNPGSNMKLASGIAPITTYLRKGINVALGTDGPASNNCLNMFKEMQLVSGLANIREHDASSVSSLDVLRMATVNGASVCGMQDADVLATGKLADIVLIDLHRPNMYPQGNVISNLTYSCNLSNVLMTMIGGRILYDHGEYCISEKPESIYRAAQAVADRLLG